MSININDEHFELIELLGKQALFTDGRIKRESVPESVFAYDFRHGNSGKPLTVEPRVGVNHAGTVIMTEPLDFNKTSDGDEFIQIKGRLNFLGEHRTFEEFMSERSENNPAGQKTQTEPCESRDHSGFEDEGGIEP